MLTDLRSRGGEGRGRGGGRGDLEQFGLISRPVWGFVVLQLLSDI